MAGDRSQVQFTASFPVPVLIKRLSLMYVLVASLIVLVSIGAPTSSLRAFCAHILDGSVVLVPSLKFQLVASFVSVALFVRSASPRLTPLNLDLGLELHWFLPESGRSQSDHLLHMALPVTEIVNHTQQVLNIKVGNHRYFVDFAKIRRGAKHTIQVDYSDTYQEFLIRADRTGKNVIVTSDDCCDYQCITIKEVDGQFAVDRVPRIRYRSGELVPASGAVAKHGGTWKTLWKIRM